MQTLFESSPLPSTTTGAPPAGGPPGPPPPCSGEGDVPEPSQNPPLEEIIRFLSASRCPFATWLKERIDSLAYADAEDVVQESIVRVHFKGIGILGMEHLGDISDIEPEDLRELMEWFYKVLTYRFRRFIYRRGIDLVRRRRSIRMGGGFLHVDIDSLKDSIEANSVVITTSECAEAFEALLDWLEGSLSVRERIVASVYMTFFPVRPTVDEIYDDLTAAQMEEFLPRRQRNLTGADAKAAIKAQISRTRASVDEKMRGFGGSQR